MRRLAFLPTLILLLCIAPFTLAACGVKGPLKLPPPRAAAPAENTAPAASASKNDDAGSAAADYHEPDETP